jgi:hypothetical protein
LESAAQAPAPGFTNSKALFWGAGPVEDLKRYKKARCLKRQ